MREILAITHLVCTIHGKSFKGENFVVREENGYLEENFCGNMLAIVYSYFYF